MPSPGLSLVGFLDQERAVHHLRTACVPDDPGTEALAAQWRAARSRLGPPVGGAGRPEIRPIPPGQSAYVDALAGLGWVALGLALMRGAGFAMVEIDPLLSFSLTIDSAGVERHGGGLSRPPGLEELLARCLPQTTPQAEMATQQQPQSILLRSRNPNFRLLGAGHFEADGRVGVQVGAALPLAHVVRLDGRCYLQNGFHRAVAVRAAGAAAMPCLVRDLASPEELGLGPGSFDMALLESADPPTVGHFTQGRAHPVGLRAMSRVVHVSWAEYLVADE